MNEYDPLLVLSNNLKALTEREGMTQTALAQKSGVSQKTISNAIRAANPITIDNLHKLAQPFGYSGWELLTPNLLDSLSVSSLTASFTRLDDRHRQEILRHLELIARDSADAEG